MKKSLSLLISLYGSCLLVACSGGGSVLPPPPPAITVNLTPNSAQALDVNQSDSFTGTVSNDSSNQGVNWTITCPAGVNACGAMAQTKSASGVPSKYVAPANVSAPETVSVTATSVSDSTKSATVQVTVNPTPMLINPPPQMQPGNVGQPFSLNFANFVQGGTQPLTWTIKSGALPAGLTLNGSTGMVTGTPTTVATAAVIVLTCADSGNPPIPVNLQISLTIGPPGPLRITSGAPPNGIVGTPYGGTHILKGFSFTGFPLSATGGVSGYSWSWGAAQGSSLPPGLNVSVLSLGGGNRCCLTVPVISGTPTAAGTYNVIVTVADSGSPAVHTSANYTITIQASGQPAGFTATGSMGTPRKLHTATLLHDGRVLITGGDNGTISLSTAEIFDPRPGSFIPTTGAMRDVRTAHTATLLADGRVLVAGGANSTGMALSTAEIFNLKTGMFTPTGNMNAERAYSTATLLTNGKVLVTGGIDANGTLLATAELFDASKGTFTSTGSMASPRSGHSATLLRDGNLLVVGGGQGTAEEFDPSSEVFTPSGVTGSTLGESTTLLSDDKVLIAGGAISTYVSGGSTRCCVYKSESLASAELFDPNSRSSAPFGNMQTARSSHTATLLNDGKVLVTGGGTFATIRQYPLKQRFQSLASVELYDPASGAFAPTDGMTSARSSHTATLLKDGRVLVTGGLDANGNVLATAELFQ